MEVLNGNMTEDLSEIKRVLRSVWWTQKRLDADLERLAWLRAKAEGVRGVEYDRQTVHGGVEHSALEDAVCAIADYEAKIETKIAQWRAALDRVTGIIYAVGDQRYQMLLLYRYRDLWTWEKIAVEMGYSWQYVHRLHSRALETANEIWRKQKEAIESDPLDVI